MFIEWPSITTHPRASLEQRPPIIDRGKAGGMRIGAIASVLQHSLAEGQKLNFKGEKYIPPVAAHNFFYIKDDFDFIRRTGLIFHRLKEKKKTILFFCNLSATRLSKFRAVTLFAMLSY